MGGEILGWICLSSIPLFFGVGIASGMDWGKPVKPAWLPRDIVAPVSDAEKDAVRVAQRALRLVPTGDMDEATKASLRGAQYLYGLPVTGVLDEATAIVIDGLRPYSLQGDE